MGMDLIQKVNHCGWSRIRSTYNNMLVTSRYGINSPNVVLGNQQWSQPLQLSEKQKNDLIVSNRIAYSQ